MAFEFEIHGHSSFGGSKHFSIEIKIQFREDITTQYEVETYLLIFYDLFIRNYLNYQSKENSITIDITGMHYDIFVPLTLISEMNYTILLNSNINTCIEKNKLLFLKISYIPAETSLRSFVEAFERCQI